MVDLILKKLCEYGDRLQEEAENMTKQKKESYKLRAEFERKVVQKCIKLVHDAFKECENKKVRITDVNPDNEVEKLIFTIPDLRIYNDTIDGGRYYELDNMHFDTPSEVFRYTVLIRERNKRLHESIEALKAILNRFDNLKDKNEKAVEQRRTESKEVIDDGEDWIG